MYQATLEPASRTMAFSLMRMAAMTTVAPMASMADAQETFEGIGPATAITKVVTGLDFAEGPASDRNGNLYFTDFPKNRIYQFSRSGKLSVFAEHSGQANGLMVNSTGELVACQMDGRVVAYSLQDPNAMRVVAAKYNKHGLNAPNDLVIDAVGGVYFTDPPLENTPLRQDRIGVYYAATDGRVSRLIDDLKFPNGVILSPDEKTLYVIDSKSPDVMAYSVLAPGRIDRARPFCQLEQNPQANMPGGDGVTVDCKGNLYVASPLGVQVVNTAGKSLGIITVPEQAYNVTFGGKEQSTLFIAAESSVYAVQMETKGHVFPAGRQEHSKKDTK